LLLFASRYPSDIADSAPAILEYATESLKDYEDDQDEKKITATLTGDLDAT
jgi:hypothetical protein